MGAVELMDLVKKLPEREVLDFARMVEDWSEDLVDQRLEAAVQAGAFDELAAEAVREMEAGKTAMLDEVLDNARLS